MTLSVVDKVAWYWMRPTDGAELAYWHLVRGTLCSPPPLDAPFIAACDVESAPYSLPAGAKWGDLPSIPHCFACQRQANVLAGGDRARISTHPLMRP
jgi:hypothetical protein